MSDRQALVDAILAATGVPREFLEGPSTYAGSSFGLNLYTLDAEGNRHDPD
jgi:hypothetical protein